MSDNGNEPAYPAERASTWQAHGLTKRELFAAMAMQGFLSNRDNGSEGADQIAEWSVAAADALVAELSK